MSAPLGQPTEDSVPGLAIMDNPAYWYSGLAYSKRNNAGSIPRQEGESEQDCEKQI